MSRLRFTLCAFLLTHVQMASLLSPWAEIGTELQLTLWSFGALIQSSEFEAVVKSHEILSGVDATPLWRGAVTCMFLALISSILLFLQSLRSEEQQVTKKTLSILSVCVIFNILGLALYSEAYNEVFALLCDYANADVTDIEATKISVGPILCILSLTVNAAVCAVIFLSKYR